MSTEWIEPTTHSEPEWTPTPYGFELSRNLGGGTDLLSTLSMNTSNHREAWTTYFACELLAVRGTGAVITKAASATAGRSLFAFLSFSHSSKARCAFLVATHFLVTGFPILIVSCLSAQRILGPQPFGHVCQLMPNLLRLRGQQGP